MKFYHHATVTANSALINGRTYPFGQDFFWAGRVREVSEVRTMSDAQVVQLFNDIVALSEKDPKVSLHSMRKHSGGIPFRAYRGTLIDEILTRLALLFATSSRPKIYARTDRRHHNALRANFRWAAARKD